MAAAGAQLPTPEAPAAGAALAQTDTQGEPSRQPAAVYLARLGPGSRRTVRQALDAVPGLVSGGRHDARTLPWASLRYSETQAVPAARAERYAPATVNKMLAALRGVLKEAWRLGLVDAAAYQRAADVQGVRATTLPRGRALEGGDLLALMRWCAADATPRGARDAALLALRYGGGLRRSEAVAVALADYDPETGALTVRHGKGDQARTAYLTNGARTAVADWLAGRGAAPGALLCPVNKRGAVTGRAMDDGAVRKILIRLAGAAVVRPFSPHDLRRTFISDLLQAQVDISIVSRLAGHANIHTTRLYDRRGSRPSARGREAAPALLRAPRAAAPGGDVMDEPDAGEDRPSPERVAALRAAVRRAERREGNADDAAALAALARWLWEQFAGPLSAGDAARYHAANRCLFAPQTEEEAAADALVRKLLG